VAMKLNENVDKEGWKGSSPWVMFDCVRDDPCEERTLKGGVEPWMRFASMYWNMWVLSS
jgi:hypothetical protein